MKINNKLVFWIVTLISLAIYILTLNPDVTYTDSGELAGACVKLGVAHPTGYPLFILIGHLWTLLPLPFSKIYSLNLFAGILTAISAGIFSQSISILLANLDKELKESNLNLIALTTALTYSFSLTVWQVANAIEVYSLHLLMINLVIHFAIKSYLSIDQKQKYLMITSLLLGISFANHLTTVLLLPGLFYFIFKIEKDLKLISRIKSFGIVISLVAVGGTLYLLMPIISSTNPEFNWGMVHRGMDKFWYHALGKQYQVWMFTGSEAFFENLIKFVKILPYQFAFIGFIPLFLGSYFLYTKSKDLFYFTSILIISCTLYSFNYSIHDIESYFLLAFIGFFIFISFGFALINLKFKKFLFLIILLPIITLILNYKECDNSKDYMVSEYTKILVDNLEPNAVIISSQWDYWVSAFWYKQRVENYRKDVILIEKEILRRTWYLKQIQNWYPTLKINSKEIGSFNEQLELFESNKDYDPVQIQTRFLLMINSFIEKNILNRPIYLTLDVMQTEPAIAENYDKIPFGFAFKLVPKGTQPKSNVESIHVEKFIAGIKLGDENHLAVGIREIASLNLTNIARYAIITKQFEVARKAVDMSLKIDNKNTMAIQAKELLKNK
jgi:hypothetical protein